MKYFLLVPILFMCISAQAQFQLNGVATSLGGNIYQLTPSSPALFGAIWYKLQHNLNTPFNVQGQMNFGTDPGGADGITFVMQNGCLSAGGAGGGIGYSGMSGQSIGIEFDTYQNISGTGAELNNDPVFDHIAVEKNGDVVHDASTNDITAPIQMDPVLSNVKNGAWYNFQISYSPTTNNLRVFFNGSLRVNITYDIKTNVFAGNNWTYWGFTSSTGGRSNIQQIYIDKTLSSFLLNDATICTGSIPVTLNPLTSLRGTNLALANPSVASTNNIDAGLAFDGNMSSRWTGAWTDNEWIYVDLQSPTDIDSVTLDWEAAYASGYIIQTSNDAITWTNQFTTTTENGGHDKIVFSASNIRYVKLQSTQRGFLPYGISLWEFRVYGQPKYLWSTNNGTNATISPNVYSSSVTLNPAATTTYSVMIPDPCLGFTNYSMTVTVDCTAPVELLNFNATPKNETVSITWETASEQNSNYFEILKSNDGIHFNTIGNEVAAHNSNRLVSYDYTDYEGLNSNNVYYKIASVDYNGYRQESAIKTLRKEYNKSFVLNPVFEDETFIIATDENNTILSYQIYDMQGRSLATQAVENSTKISIGKSLIPGCYIVLIKTATGVSPIHISKIK